MPCTGTGENGQRVTGCEAHIALSRRAASEGMVLLKNEEQLLPIQPGAMVALFGKAQADYVKGGGGSGDTTVAYVRSLLDGLRIKEGEGKVRLFAPLSDYYEENVKVQYAAGKKPGQTEEPAVPAELLEAAKEQADLAIITICRFSDEGHDRTGCDHDGDFYLSLGEEAMVQAVCSAFKHVAVVLNIGGMMDTLWFKDQPGIQAALLAWQGGMEGGLATADILVGDACPSGHLTDTFAARFADYPSSATFFESEDYVTYDEDIYVGYRYFETIPGAAEKVCYPFGYGLSYTTFAITDVNGCVDEQGSIRLTAKVTNTGKVAGREVVQAYCEAPQGKMGKPSLVLIAFAKTALLAPGESEQVIMTAAPYLFASYDDKGQVQRSAYVLEKGDYFFHIGSNVRDTLKTGFIYQVNEDTVVEQLSAKCQPTMLKQRLLADGTMESIPEVAEKVQPTVTDYTIIPTDRGPVEQPWGTPSWNTPRPSMLIDVYEGKITLEAFMAQLSDEQLVNILGGQPCRGVANTQGFGNLPWFGIPNAMTADGPAGLRILPECGVNTTAFPCATLLACSWDLPLAEEIGIAAAKEVHENGIGIWLAPAINIHRTPLCGRNFEYYSEDPLVAGCMAAAMVQGIQSQGVAASVKHFACNNKETNRLESDSRLSERALREIYLKGFELCVKAAQPWTIMSSYNIINGTRSGENRELLTDILRSEWGFEGLVTTDWFAHTQEWREINAGNDIKMPCGMPEHTVQMLKEGKLNREDLMNSVQRLLELLLKLA